MYVGWIFKGLLSWDSSLENWLSDVDSASSGVEN